MMYYLVLAILLLGFLGVAQSPVKVFKFHSVTVFVKDESNNPAKGALVKAFSPEWGVAYPHFEEWGLQMERASLDLFCPQVTGFSLPRMVGIIRFGIPTGDFH